MHIEIPRLHFIHPRHIYRIRISTSFKYFAVEVSKNIIFTEWNMGHDVLVQFTPSFSLLSISVELQRRILKRILPSFQKYLFIVVAIFGSFDKIIKILMMANLTQ